MCSIVIQVLLTFSKNVHGGLNTNLLTSKKGPYILFNNELEPYFVTISE